MLSVQFLYFLTFSHSSLETQQQRNCPPLISITDENDCVQMPMPISFFSRNNEKVQVSLLVCS